MMFLELINVLWSWKANRLSFFMTHPQATLAHPNLLILCMNAYVVWLILWVYCWCIAYVGWLILCKYIQENYVEVFSFFIFVILLPMFKSLQKFVTEVQVSKVPNLSSKELETLAKSFCQHLVDWWIVINRISWLKESVDLTSGEVKPEVISLWMWNWFINLTASRSIYFKSWNKYFNLAAITASWIEYGPSANWIFAKIKTFQKERLV